MGENLTRPTDVDPAAFVGAVAHPGRREDALAMLGLMHRVTGWAPRMWGPTIVGYGRYRYRYPSGREGEAAATGFSPRRADLVVYVTTGFDALGDRLAALGPHRTGRSCLYLGRLAGVDTGVLGEIIAAGLADLRERYEVTAG